MGILAQDVVFFILHWSRLVLPPCRNGASDEGDEGDEGRHIDQQDRALCPLEAKSSVKKSDCKKVLESLAEVAAKEVKKGKFTIPGVVMIKTRMKPATKAGKRE